MRGHALFENAGLDLKMFESHGFDLSPGFDLGAQGLICMPRALSESLRLDLTARGLTCEPGLDVRTKSLM